MRYLLLFILNWLAIGAWAQAPLAAPPKVLVWQFPARRPHAGALLGNGRQGLMVWGQGRQLNITIGRAGFWDRRGGNDFTARTTYRDVKRLLEAKDEAGLRKVFAQPTKAEGSPKEPQQVGGGRLELTLPVGWQLLRAELNLLRAELKVIATSPGGQAATFRLRQAVPEELAWLELPPALLGKLEIKLVPSWEFVKDQLAKVGVAPPQVWQSPSPTGQVVGFTQTLPADEPLSIGYQLRGANLLINSHLGRGAQAQAALNLSLAQPSLLARTADAWWQTYWAEVPAVSLPDPVLQEIVDYGLYKQACLTPPHGVAATLQGCFNEDYQLPPWSNDYHFNINIQMIYQPALMTNRPGHLWTMWNLIKEWMPRLQANGSQFFGRDGALMLPHAVDDRCQVVGTFWSGTIDHACTAWMAQLAWQHYRYTLDQPLLTDLAWPLLNGAFEGYWAMLERQTDSTGTERFTLPVSVSPEYRGSRLDAWGRNASFQLAALHAMAEMLPQAAAALGRPVDPRWAEVRAKLPLYATITHTVQDEFNLVRKQIALWEGLPLPESHRHHSHLASIYPFKTIDPLAAEHQELVNNSLLAWTAQGMGAWSGWCVPWAATLRARVNQPETAISLLYWWRQNFVNEGRGTLHDAYTPGLSLLASPVRAKLPPSQPNREIMQMDAGFGALSAVLELLVQERRNGVHVLPSLPLGWATASFTNLRVEGAFLLGAKVEKGQTGQITVKSLRGGKLRLVHYLGPNWTLNGQPQTGPVLERECAPGEQLVLKRN
jgi:alpha-L-fucosidase 2